MGEKLSIIELNKAFAKKRVSHIEGGNQESCPQSLEGHYTRIPQFSLRIHAKKDGLGDCGRGGPHQILMYHDTEYFHQFYK